MDSRALAHSRFEAQTQPDGFFIIIPGRGKPNSLNVLNICSGAGQKHARSSKFIQCQRVGMPGLGRLSTYRPAKWSNKQHTSADQTPIPCVPWIKTERGGGAKSGHSGALNEGKPKNAATSACYLPTNHNRAILVMPAQPAPGECHHKYKKR